MKIIENCGFYIAIMDDENYGIYHNLNGPGIIFTKGQYAGILQYFIYGEWIGNNLSNKEFEKLKNIELKKRVFE